MKSWHQLVEFVLQRNVSIDEIQSRFVNRLKSINEFVIEEYQRVYRVSSRENQLLPIDESIRSVITIEPSTIRSNQAMNDRAQTKMIPFVSIKKIGYVDDRNQKRVTS